MKRRVSVHQGFAAISAVFLLVVLAALGAFMLTFSSSQQLNLAQDVKGARAYWAARAGLEWEIPQVIAANTCPAATATFVVETFNVDISCSAASYNDGMTVTIVKMTAVACAQSPCGSGVGGIGYVERSVSASIER